jgi:histidinol-phosphate/aromatic aminotransferase/cobyric acid decarboxylase-like protein
MINPYFPPQDMLNKIGSRIGELSRNYSSTNRHISMLLSKYLNLDVDNVVIANGASELISAVGRLFVRNIAIPIPTFDEYINRLRTQGKPVSLFEIEKESFDLDLNLYIEFAKTSNSNTILLVRPNNPTGKLITKIELRNTLDRLIDFDLVIVDESFIEFSGMEENESILEYINTYKNIIIIKSLSKVYGIPGMRIGCAISSNAHRIETLRKELPIWNVNSFAQCFIEMIKDYQKEFDESCVKAVRATEMLYTELSKLEYLYPYPTLANFVLCRLVDSVESDELITYLYENRKILIYDCSKKIGMNSRYIRIASRSIEENEELILAMRAFKG